MYWEAEENAAVCDDSLKPQLKTNLVGGGHIGRMF